MKNKSINEYHLKAANKYINEAGQHVNWALNELQRQPLAPAYKTPQWHHTVLWSGFAFVIGMLLGACLTSL